MLKWKHRNHQQTLQKDGQFAQKVRFMRSTTLIAIYVLLLAGCFAGTNHGQTTTVHFIDDGINPDRIETYTVTSDGTYVGGGMPGMAVGYGNVGNGYGYAGSYGNDGLMHNDEHVVVYQSTLIRPTIVDSDVTAGNQMQAIDASRDNRSAKSPQVFLDLAKQAQNEKHDTKREAHIKICQIILNNPDVFDDPDERRTEIANCKTALAKNSNRK
jgi:hypothetical protein